MSGQSHKEQGVDSGTFDRLTRSLSDRISRRSAIRRLAAGTAAAPASVAVAGGVRADGKDKEKDRNAQSQSRCRSEGQACENNQTCCSGLICNVSGNSSARRCITIANAAASASGTSSDSNTVIVNNSSSACAGDCVVDQNTSTNVNSAIGGLAASGFGTLPQISIEVNCTYESAAFQTVCMALGDVSQQWESVKDISLPFDNVCVVTIDRIFQPPKFEEVVTRIPASGGGQASAGNGGTANADASGGTVSIGNVNSGGNSGNNNDTNISVDASGGTANADASGGDGNVAIAGGGAPEQVIREMRLVAPASLQVVFEGNVAPAGRAVWWLETDQGRLPAYGPALDRVAATTPSNGSIVVSGFSCPQGGADQAAAWFGQCTEPATGLELRLTPAAGGETLSRQVNDMGRTRFDDLAPGRYQFEVPTGSWCHAESDAFDPATGELIVEADRESNVWLFTCPAA